MSTYTDLHTRRRETLTILRQPGSIDDGITPQRVIFANPENIYEGTFKGKIDAVDVNLSGVALTDATINNGVIRDAQIYSNGEVVQIADLTSDIYSISTAISSQMSHVSADVIDALSIDSLLQQLSVNLDKSIDKSISSLSGTIDAEFNTAYHEFDSRISAVSAILSTALSTEIQQRVHQNSILQSRTTDISIQFDSHVEDFNDFSSMMSSRLDQHVEDNERTFNFLSNLMLSSIEHDKHYTIYGANGETTKSIPYPVKEFAVNIIRTGTTDVQIVFNEDGVIGYGTYLDESMSTLEVTIDASRSTTLKQYVFSWPYTCTIQLTNDGTYKPVPGGKQYTIAWINSSVEGNRIVLQPYGTTESVLKYNEETIGTIKEPMFDDNGFLSGTLLIDKHGHDSRFDVFADAFQNYQLDRSLVDNPQYDMEFKCGIGLKPDLSSLIFMKDVETRNVIELIDTDGYRFGFVRDTGVQKDLHGNIVSLSVEGISLAYKQYQDIQSTSAVLDVENMFNAQIGNSTWISCDTQNGNVFTIAKVENKYSYNFYDEDDIEQSPESCRGYIVPDLVNKTILDDDTFDSLSVMTDFVDPDGPIAWHKTYLLNKIGDGIWEYLDGSRADRTRDYVHLRVQKIGNTYRLFIDFIDTTGFQLAEKQYTVKTTMPEKYADASEQTIVLQSTQTDFNSTVEEFVARQTFYVAIPPASDVDAQTFYLDVSQLASKTFKVRVPSKSRQYSDISREFIVAAHVASSENYVEVELVKEDGTRAETVWARPEAFTIPTRKLTVFKVIEISYDKFFIEDLNDNFIYAEIGKLVEDLEIESTTRQAADDYLSSAILSNKAEIDDLWKNIRGGLNYIDMLSIGNFGCETIYDYLIWNKEKGVKVPDRLREGFFYVVQTPDKNVHYQIQNIDVEYGDWLIVKNNTPLSSIDISDIAVFDVADYDNFKLSSDNNIAGHNVFNGQTDFVGDVSIKNASIESLSAQNATVQNAEVIDASIDSATINALSVASVSVELEDIIYGNGLSTLEELTSSINKQIVSAQLSIAGISAYLAEDLSTEMHYFGTLSSGYGQRIELSGFLHDNFNDDNYQFNKGNQYRISTDLAIKNSSGDKLLNLHANDYIVFNTSVLLKNASTSCIDIIRDAQSEGEALQSQIDYLSGALSDCILSTESFALSIANASADYSLVGSDSLSILTALRQHDGKTSISARNLVSSDVGQLSGFVDSKFNSALQYTSENYLPLSGGQLVGSLTLDNGYSLNVYDSNSIVVGNQTLCAALSSEIEISASKAIQQLSIDLSNDFGFGYDAIANVISAHVAGKTLQFSADKFTEARMISAVGVVYRGEGDDKKPYLQILFKTDSGIETVEISLLEIMPLYYGKDGIDIRYDSAIGKYAVSADASVCRRSDISSINVDSTIQPGMMLSSLKQEHGLISYETSPILSSYVEGLSDYVDYALSNYNAPLSTIYGKWNIFQSDPNDPHIDEIRLSVTSEAGVDKTWYAPFSNGQQLADYQQLVDQYYIKFPANGTIHETVITRKADYYILGNHINQPIQPKISFDMLSALDAYPLDGSLDFDSSLSTVISAVVSIRDMLKQLRNSIENFA